MSSTPLGPRNAVVVLLDSLNRHLVGPYGAREFATPNLDRFARRAVRFDAHFAGSLPCMPARHDLLCGALDFLWKPWGSIELWEEPLTVALRRVGVVTMLVSDHPHLFEVGGENYHCDFTAWDYQRGHESDPWRTRPDPSWIGAPSFGRGHTPYDDSRGWFRGEEDFPGPRTLAKAARWLEEEAPAHERFLLFVDEFDPHEPFDTPEPYAAMYDPEWEGPHLIWPPYTPSGVGSGVLSERQARQLRACYGGKLTMIDRWLGRVLDALDRGGLWDSTAVFVCTDHGHYLGERDAFGKPALPVFEPMGHIPLLVAWPGAAAGACDSLTTNVDVHATLLELFGARAEHRTHGRSLAPLLRGEARAIREWALCGYWGREVHVVDGRTKYARAPAGANAPLSVFSNRWSTMPVHRLPDLRLPKPDARAWLDRMPGSTVPVLRQPFGPGDRLPFWALGPFRGNHLYDLREDPGEARNLAGTPAEKRAEELLREALLAVEAPGDQLARLGLA
ncbi:MAG TPA: sulfatase-like hydrolase/transferase [Casimicrobiaceae bacterium]|nr:sulfatase-like hydrolase/transferase [Myxococcota bacterium]HTS23021.1 sulfatase-like hydrolase/transferase [Casimicrobiaceae bacterium]